MSKSVCKWLFDLENFLDLLTDKFFSGIVGNNHYSFGFYFAIRRIINSRDLDLTN